MCIVHGAQTTSTRTPSPTPPSPIHTHPHTPSPPPPSPHTQVHPLITFLPAPRNTTGVNLLATVTDKERAAREAAESAAAQEEEKLPRKIVSFLKPNVTIAMVCTGGGGSCEWGVGVSGR